MRRFPSDREGEEEGEGISVFVGKIGRKECSFSSAQFQTPHRAKGSRGRYGLPGSASLEAEKRQKEKEKERKRKRGGPVGRSGAQSVGVSRLPSVLSPTRSVDR